MAHKKVFHLHAPFGISDAQRQALTLLSERNNTPGLLIGVTGSGKTFTMANIIAAQEKPVLVLAPNKTLAAQLYEEFSLFFPQNKVCYFVSYYDYYQPESYLPAQDVYIPKETKINDELDRLRIEATASIISRPDTIVIASVSSIYSLGNPADYRDLSFIVSVGMKISKVLFMRRLVAIQFARNDMSKDAGTFHVVGNVVYVVVPYHKDVLRVEFFGDNIDGLALVNKMTYEQHFVLDNYLLFPAKHFVVPDSRRDLAIEAIKDELMRCKDMLVNLLYKERLINRVTHDIEMLQQVGYVSGIENYSVFFDGRKSGERPYCLLDFFDHDFLFIIDESHIAIPQLRGMYAGDKARKKVLVDYGFRLPSAYDNRPLMFQEVEQFFTNVIFVSATPGDYELSKAEVVAEQIIRPTGLLDPEIFVHQRDGQMEHLIEQINKTTAEGNRSLVMVLTKKLAEQVAHFLEKHRISVCYLHSELKTPQRSELLYKLRTGEFDCLVGVNLLREGIDLPEVAFVAIMDADIESFLRDKRSLIQIIGRAARNVNAKVFLYADSITRSMQMAIDETKRRRDIQERFNKEHGIVPASVQRDVVKSIALIGAGTKKAKAAKKSDERVAGNISVEKISIEQEKQIVALEEQMRRAADELRFEDAIALRAQWFALTADKKRA